MDLDKLTKKQKIIGILSLLALILVVIIIAFVTSKSGNEPKNISTNFDQPTDIERLSTNYIFVDISGQVVNPGIYQLPDNFRVLEAIEKAGGFTAKADMFFVHKSILLATKIQDGQKIYVPQVGENGSPGLNSDLSVNKLVSINNGTLEDLMSLPSIGQVTAEKIIAARPFKAIEDLKNVSGIGDATFEKIKKVVTL